MATAAAATPKTTPQIECASQTAKENFHIAAQNLALDQEMQTLLSTPMREMVVEVPLRRDDARMEVLACVRVQHNGVRGPVMGGIRFHPAIDIERARALAQVTTWKNAVVGSCLARGMVVVVPPEGTDAPDSSWAGPAAPLWVTFHPGGSWMSNCPAWMTLGGRFEPDVQPAIRNAAGKASGTTYKRRFSSASRVKTPPFGSETT